MKCDEPLDYAAFLERKSQSGSAVGFEPIWMPDFLFDFQKHIINWAVHRGRAAILADCGLGKTPMQLVWAENIVRKTNKRILDLTPLAVSGQTLREANKFGIDAGRSRDGKLPSSKIVITNYERLDHFDPADFIGVVCDESSIIKCVSGATRKKITRFISKMPYRLLATATAAPNDYVELGTSSEALGELSNSEMLKRFFRQLDDKGQKKETRDQDEAEVAIKADSSYYQKLAYRVAQTIGQWRLKHHAVTPFWRWVASWALACRKPSDLGFSDDRFVLPPLIERDHTIEAGTSPGMLFELPAFGLAEERDERRRTLKARCEFAAVLANHRRPTVLWCHMNDEGDLLEEIIPGARQISGRTPDDEKEELYDAFSSGQLNKLVIKPKIGAWGLNWTHCSHTISFATHSFESYYQSLRRFYRFGQKNPVEADLITTPGEIRVMANMRKKAGKANVMFDRLVGEMNRSTRISRENIYTNKQEVPSWL